MYSKIFPNFDKNVIICKSESNFLIQCIKLLISWRLGTSGERQKILEIY